MEKSSGHAPEISFYRIGVRMSSLKVPWQSPLSIMMACTGQKAFLYYFTYVEAGKRAPLGAYHGEELNFLSNVFPDDWEHSQDDEKLGEILRTYWVQFAKTGDPNGAGIPEWPAYDTRKDECFELGLKIGGRPVAVQLQALERIMKQNFAETTEAH